MMHHFELDAFSPEEQARIAHLDPAAIPCHVAVIMDGNGRWASAQGLPRVIGHRAGVESIRQLVDGSLGLGIRYITLYSFSTENWTRPESEVHTLMHLIEEQLRLELAALHARGVRIRHLGRTAGLPDSLRDILRECETVTAGHTKLTLQFAINYSGRAELADAARRIGEAVAAGTLAPEAIDETAVAQALYTPDIPDPDLLIRTGGDLRISNYLLWECAYSEFWFSPVLWPDFRQTHLLEAIESYQHRQRKFGGVMS